jgi:hypothetical protein
MIKPSVVEPISYAGYRFPPEVISYAVWLYFRFPLSLRMVEEMLAARSIDVTYETLRQWALKFGLKAAKRIRARVSTFGDKWHLDEVVITIKGKRHWGTVKLSEKGRSFSADLDFANYTAAIWAQVTSFPAANAWTRSSRFCLASQL